MLTAQFHVSGMLNSQCKTQVKNALDKLEGVQEVQGDLAGETVKVAYNDPADESGIRHCIEHTGFRIV